MKMNHELPNAEEYIKLRASSGMKGKEKSTKNVDIALSRSLYVVCIRDGDKLIGFGRIVGDGAITYVVSDVMVDKSYQGKGIGKLIMSEIDKYFEENTDEDAYITLTAVKPADSLYKQFKFNDVEPFSIGMKRMSKHYE